MSDGSSHLEAFNTTVFGNGRPVRRAWAPRLDIWYRANKALDTLPQPYGRMSLEEVEEYLGCLPHRRDARAYNESFSNLEVVEQSEGSVLTREFHTPYGSISEQFKYPTDPASIAAGYPPLLVKHRVAGLDDYRPAVFVEDHTDFEPAFSGLKRLCKSMAGDGFVITNLGYDPMYTVLNDYVGFDNAYFELADHRSEVTDLYEAVWRKNLRKLDAVANAPVTILLHGAHFDGAMTPPPVFAEFMVPYYQSIRTWFERNGKMLAFHADADSFGLLEMYAECGIGLVDCFCTEPMGRVTLEAALNAWGSDIVIWGGIPSVILHSDLYSDEDFRAYLKDLFDLCTNRASLRLVLGVADNVMPEADIGRLEEVARLAKELPA